MRIGTGFDLHRLVKGRKLILGGMEIPFEYGLEGHSDGDALVHAIIDALLGAACLGDIGMWFSPEDPKFKDANSIDMLKQVNAKLKELGYGIVNIDSTIMCEQPKLSKSFVVIRQKLSEVLGLDINQVSVKATTYEGLGEIGRGEAIAVQAVALLSKGKSNIQS